LGDLLIIDGGGGGKGDHNKRQNEVVGVQELRQI